MIKWTELEIDPVFLEKIKAEFNKAGSDKPMHSYERVYQHFFAET
jgi:hypothetical protein